MSYTTGSADSYLDLLGKIKSIAEAQGWVTRSWGNGIWLVSSADGNANYSVTVVNTDAQPFWGYNSMGPCIAISNCKSLNPNLGPWAQPGQDFASGKESRTAILYFGINGPFAKYHAFVTSQYIHVVVEAITGTFGHIVMGNIDKDGAVYDGGSYNAASQVYRSVNNEAPASDSSNGNGLGGPFAMFPFTNRYPYYSASRIRIENVDNLGSPSCDNFYSVGQNYEGTSIGPWNAGWTSDGYFAEHPDSGLVAGSANTLGGNTMMIPAAIYHFGAQGRIRYMGVIPDHAVCDMKFLAPGDVVTYGTDEWMVFPTFRKGTQSASSTLNAGVAYRLRR
jgi:hypothetical protein